MQVKCPVCGTLVLAVLPCCCNHVGSLDAISFLFPCSHLHPIMYQAEKGVNAACNIPGDVVPHLFPISSINLLVWERTPRKEEGARSKALLWLLWCPTQTASPALTLTHPSLQLLMADGPAKSLSPGHQGPVLTPTPRHPASNDRSGEFKGLASPFFKVG